MISGMNTDMDYQGKTYHIQTEDGGLKNPSITTQVFFKGAILATQKTNYADIIKAEFLEDLVKDLMKQQHGLVIKELASGRLLEKKPHENPGGGERKSSGQEPSATQEQGVPRKSLDDMILDYLVSKKEKSNS